MDCVIWVCSRETRNMLYVEVAPLEGVDTSQRPARCSLCGKKETKTISFTPVTKSTWLELVKINNHTAAYANLKAAEAEYLRVAGWAPMSCEGGTIRWRRPNGGMDHLDHRTAMDVQSLADRRTFGELL